MQSEVIDDILSVEDRAEKTVEDAQSTARKIISDAHDKAAKTISDAVEEARRDGQKSVDDAEKLLQQHLAAYEQACSDAGKTAAAVDQAVIDRASDRIIKRICSIGAAGDNV